MRLARKQQHEGEQRLPGYLLPIAAAAMLAIAAPCLAEESQADCTVVSASNDRGGAEAFCAVEPSELFAAPVEAADDRGRAVVRAKFLDASAVATREAVQVVLWDEKRCCGKVGGTQIDRAAANGPVAVRNAVPGGRGH